VLFRSHRRSIAAWIASDADNACRKSPPPLPPLELDVTATEWLTEGATEGVFDGILCCNLTHVAPWPVTEGLMRGAARVLAETGALWLYGPFLRDGRATSEGDARFDATLRARDPALGLRDLDDVTRLAAGEGLRLSDRVDMPANNLFIRFAKA